MTETKFPEDEGFARDWVAYKRKVDEISSALATVSAASGASFVTGDLISSFATTRVGALLCDGSSFANVDHPDLAAMLRAIDPIYILDADNTYVPDYRERVIGGAGFSFVLGIAQGALTVTLTGIQSGIAAHNHTGSVVVTAETAHTHTDIGTTGGAAVGNYVQITAGTNNFNISTSAGSSHTHTASLSISSITTTPAASAHSNTQPTLPANIFIKT